MPIILAIGAAIGWGTADFFGGVSRRQASVFVIIAVSELAGVIVLIPIMIARGTPLPDSPSMLLACLAGIAVTVELGLIYAALSRGKAFITAPVGGLGTAVAATVGLLEGDRLDLMIALGLLCALIGSGVSAWTNQPRQPAAPDRLRRSCLRRRGRVRRDHADLPARGWSRQPITDILPRCCTAPSPVRERTAPATRYATLRSMRPPTG